ncbi:MAG: response regulator [Rhodospirillales bacterium]|nr:response regulator [Rhodospirillales bacterium]
MEKLHFEHVDLLVIDPAASARETIKNILYNQGFRNLYLGASLDELQEHMSHAMPDLLISETELEDGDFCEFVTKLRHHDVGENPFLPVIWLTWEATPERVRSVVNAGVDDLLTKPLSTGHLVNRIKALIKDRKPFIVTSEYIGPDRRTLEERKSGIPQLDVPNTLKVKATGKEKTVDVVKAITSVVAEINVQKLERYGVQVCFLIEHILPNLENGVVDSTNEAFLERLLGVAKDTARRLVGTKYAHISELCDSLVKVTDSILATKDQPNDRDVKLLAPLSQAIKAAFVADDEQTTATVRQIHTQIDKS